MVDRARSSNSCEAQPGEKWHICKGNQSAGAARQIADHLDKIPRETYVEPFLGLGNVYRAEKRHEGKEILNDLDCQRMRAAKERTCSTKSQTKCEIMKEAKTTCGKDYKQFLKRYDDRDTLFYLDPPYGTKNERYKERGPDFEEFANSIDSIKHAKVAVSFTDNKEFRDRFCGEFTCHKIKKNILGKSFYNDILAIKK